MKKLIILYLIALIGIAIPIDSYSQYKAPCFRPGVNANLQGQSTNYIITTDSTISYGSSQTISSLFITGQAVFDNSYDSHVRVVLCDNYNTEYLIYESYPLMADSSVNNFSKTAVETRMLSNVTPQSLKFKVHNAHIDIDSIYTAGPVTLNNGHMMAMAANKVEQDSLIVERLNQKLEAGNKTWRARCTSVSELTYDEKKDLFGGNVPALYGFEYYSYGVFVMPDYEQQIVQGQAPTPSNSPYVEEWDWRNRHGKNWMTPVKNQRGCGSCWAFSGVGTVEAYANLYFNQLLNFDLSEQEVVSCANAGTCKEGYLYKTLDYLCTNGVVEEECFNYTATNNDCGNKCVDPNDRVSVYDNQYFYCYTIEDSLKSQVIKTPMAFGVRPWHHFLVLAGYKKINEGEQYHSSSDPYTIISILPDNPLIGYAAWLLKNSWGSYWGDNGYCHIAFNLNDAYSVYKLIGNVNSDLLDDDDIVCEDADGDGYFNWGIGPRPSTCPSWAPLERDGDDSDYTKGPLTQYGFLTDINPDLNDTIFIDENTLFNERMYSHKHIVVRNNSSLTLSNLLTCYDGVKIIVEDGSTLIVDGGTVENVILLPHVGSTITLKNDGHIKHNGTIPFYLPRGALLFNTFGKIE